MQGNPGVYSGAVDLDAFVAAHSSDWQRLDRLSRSRRLTVAEADELLDLYQRTATHLSIVRTSTPEPVVVGHLSLLLARARTRAGRAAPFRASRMVGFLTEAFPAALYRLRWWWGITAVTCVLVAFALGGWFLAHPTVESSLLTPAEVERLVSTDFEGYYSEHAASSFAFRVWTNNAWVAALCIAFGVLGVPVVWLLWNNLVNLALVGSVMVRHGRGDLFFGLILPHGLLELTAVFVAGGVGLRFFWSWIEPGARTRRQAFAQEGRAVVGIALGLVVVLLVSGVIEAFVTPSGLPTWARIAVGLLAEAAFLGYVWAVGGPAHRRGITGDVGAEDAAATAPAGS